MKVATPLPLAVAVNDLVPRLAAGLLGGRESEDLARLGAGTDDGDRAPAAGSSRTPLQV